MSDTIEVARVQGFAASVHHLSQQNQSLLEGRVRMHQAVGKIEYFDRLSPSNMIQVTTRHGDTVWNDIAHTRRAAVKLDYSWSQPVDEEDELELIIDPVGEYAIAASAAVGRRIDTTIVNALNGTALTGEAGAGSQALPAGQIVNSGGTTQLTLAAISSGMQIVYDTGAMITPNDVTFVHHPAGLKHIIDDTPAGAFASSDFSSGGVMHAGQVRNYLGMLWVMLPDLVNNTGFGVLPNPATDNVRCFIFHRNALGLAVWNRVSASIDKRPDKNNTTQVLVKTSIGAVRVEDELVVAVEVDESGA